MWLDLPWRIVMHQVIARTVTRIVRREELWNGNRERWSNLLCWNPNSSIIRWSSTQHAKYAKRFDSAMRSPELAHLTFVRLTSHADADSWVAEL